MILHQGQGHENGHYVTIHALDNTYWYADDRQFPVPLSHITDQHCREVVQVWLVHDNNGELVPDTVEAMEPSQPKRAKHHSETFQLVFANVTTSVPEYKTGFGSKESIYSSCRKLIWARRS